MVHSATKMTPKQATKQKDNLKAKVNMTLNYKQLKQEDTQRYQQVIKSRYTERKP